MRANVMSSRGRPFTVARAVATTVAMAALAIGMTAGSRADAATWGDNDYVMSQAGAVRNADRKYVTMFEPAARWPATYQW